MQYIRILTLILTITTLPNAITIITYFYQKVNYKNEITSAILDVYKIIIF